MLSTHNFPSRVDSIIGELAYRDSAILVDELCENLETWVVDELIKADSEERRLFLQAYAHFCRDLRRKLKQKKNQLLKDTPRILT